MGIKAYKQVEALSVTLNLLDADTQAKINKIDPLKADFDLFVATKAQASGLASLDANGKLLTTQLPALALTETNTVASEAVMLALTAQKGDVAVRTDVDKTYILAGEDPAVLADWVEILTPLDGVTAIMRNGNALTGQVALAEIAFTGDVADLTGLADVAKSGAAGDVAIADAGGLYNATTAEGAFAEVMAKVDKEITDRTNALNDAKAAVTLVKGTLIGTKDDSNTAFTVTGLDTSKILFLYRDGVEQLSSGFATRAGAAITTVLSAPASDEAMEVYGYPA